MPHTPHPIRYLLHQLYLAAALKEDSIFLPGSQRGLWKLRPDLLFVFFSSHTPCKYIQISGFMLHSSLLPYWCLIREYVSQKKTSLAKCSYSRWECLFVNSPVCLITSLPRKVEGTSLTLLLSSQFPMRIRKLKGPKPTIGLTSPKPWVVWWFILTLMSFIH